MYPFPHGLALLASECQPQVILGLRGELMQGVCCRNLMRSHSDVAWARAAGVLGWDSPVRLCPNSYLPRRRLGIASAARPRTRPTTRWSWAAAAIIDALSVHSSTDGTDRRMP